MEHKIISTKRPTAASAEDKIKAEEKMSKMRKEYSRLIKGLFEFTDAMGGWVDFNYRIFPGFIEQYKLVHGEITELPYGVVKHINNVCTKVRGMPEDISKGFKTKDCPVIRTSRMRFTPVDVI